MKTANPGANEMKLDCAVVSSAIQVSSEPTGETETTNGMKAAKSGTAGKLISPKAGVYTAVHAVLDNVILVNFFTGC